MRLTWGGPGTKKIPTGFHQWEHYITHALQEPAES